MKAVHVHSAPHRGATTEPAFVRLNRWVSDPVKLCISSSWLEKRKSEAGERTMRTGLAILTFRRPLRHEPNCCQRADALQPAPRRSGCKGWD
jgi:hypothetical protein